MNTYNVLLLSAYPPGIHQYGMEKALRQMGHPVFTAGSTSGLLPELEQALQRYDPGYHYDLVVPPDESLDLILSKCPFRPDFILYLESGIPFLPQGLANAPCPILGLLSEDLLHADHYNALFPYFDLVLCTWKSTEENYRAQGRDNVRQWYYGARPAFCIDERLDRVYDVAFLGNLNQHVQRRRLRTIQKILRLREEGFNVYVGHQAFFQDYNRIHCQSKIVYHQGISDQVNMRVFEAMGAGCLVIMRRPGDANDPSSSFFLDREDVVYCDSDEEALALIRYYARHEDERQRIAAAGHRKVMAEHNYTDVVRRLFEEVLPHVPREFREVRHQRLERYRKGVRRQRLDHARYYLTSGALEACHNQIRGINNFADDSEALNLFGLLFASASQPEPAVKCLTRACARDPRAILPRVNLASVGIAFKRPEADRWCDEALEALERRDLADASFFEGPYHSPGYDRFRLEVALAYFHHPAGPKRNAVLARLYRYRLHQLMGHLKLEQEMFGEAKAHVAQALSVIPDDGYLLYERACASTGLGERQTVVEDLRRAIELEPFFADAQYDLAVSLERLGRLDEAFAQYWDLVWHNPLMTAPAELWQRVGELALRLGKRPEALEAFEKALALKPDDSQLRGSLAELRSKPHELSVPAAHYRASIIMAIDDEPHLVQRAIMSLLQHTAPSDAYELLLIKRGSSKALNAFLSLLEGPLKMLPGGASLAADYAAAAEQATGSFLVFIDQGLAVQPDWLEPLLSSAADGHTISAPLLCDQSGSLQPAASAACFCLTHDLWRRLGGLDSDLPLPQAVIDLSLRLERQGGSVLAVPASVASAMSLKKGADTWRGLSEPESAMRDFWRERRQTLRIDEILVTRASTTGGPATPSSRKLDALKRQLVELVAGKRVLEIGERPSLPTAVLDASERVAVACHHIGGANGALDHYRQHRAELREGLGAPLPWEEDSFDVAVADIETLVEPTGVLRELTRVLTPEGQAVLALRTHSFGPAASPASGQRLFGFLRRFFEETAIFFEEGGESVRYKPLKGVRSLTECVFAVCARPRKRPAGLTSIIIPAYNKLDYTKLCLHHVRQFTEGNYEIVVVDNASTDDTWSFLQKQPGVRAVRLPENLGFPGAVNHGLAHARGEFLVLLSNDVLVPPNWSSRLLRHFHQNPKIGAVGPVTNYASGPQGVITPQLKTVEDFLGFARQHMAQPQPANEIHRLVGFLLAIRGDLIDKIGGMDPLFQPGNFEDDDFCLRARLAGFTLLMARDIFVYHFGSVTFGDGQYAELLRTNWLKFKRKWGLPDSLGPEGYGPVLPFLGNIPFSPASAFVPLPYGEPAEVAEASTPVAATSVLA